MAKIVFYEKPGCGTNGRQRRALEAAGHDLITRDLLSEPWTRESLSLFFAGASTSDWFNPASPRVKSGEIDPATCDADRALDLMVEDPLLIRRPLIDVEGLRFAGFGGAVARGLLGLPSGEATPPGLEGCGRSGPNPTCPGTRTRDDDES